MKHPRVAALHYDLHGDWEECYHYMHSLAVAIETELTCQQTELDRLKAQVASQQSIIDALIKNTTQFSVPVSTPPGMPPIQLVNICET